MGWMTRPKRKAKIGRPPKLTRALMAELCNYLSTGAPITAVCQANGIHRDTYYAWCATGLEHEVEGRHTLYREFSDKASRAVGRGHVGYWAVIARATRTGRREDVAAAKVAIAALRTRWFRKYTLAQGKEQPEEEQPQEAPSRRLDFTRLSPDERRSLLALYRKAAVPGAGEEGR